MRFAIKLPCHNAKTLPVCGDYYFGLGLSRALERLGYRTRLDPHDSWDSSRLPEDIDIVIRGQKPYTPNGENTCVYWLISHPDHTSWGELSAVDHVFFASGSITPKMHDRLGQNNASLLPQAFDREVMAFSPGRPRNHNLVFVGMKRDFDRPAVSYALDAGIEIELYGNGWLSTSAAKYLKATRVDNHNLCELYSTAAVVLNDHTPEMRINGFCSNRIFDALACGTPVVTDAVAWVPEDIKPWVYFFDDAKSFTAAIYEATHESTEKQAGRIEFTHEFRSRHSFDNRAAEIIRVLTAKSLLKSDVDYAHGKFGTSSNTDLRQTDMSLANAFCSVRGSYVNLDKSIHRRTQCEEFLERFGLRNFYSRFSGLDGADYQEQYKNTGLSAGKIGCWLSHMEAIKASCDHNYHFHLLEDDFELTPAFPDFIRNFDKHTESLGDWDILFTDFTLTNLRNVNDMKQIIDKVNRLQKENRFVIENAHNLYAAGNSSYIVNKNSKLKVVEILQNGLATTKIPKDIYLREQARKGNLKIFVTLPFLTTLNDTFMESDILGKIDDRNPSIINNVIFRKSLSFGADTKSLLKLIKKRISEQKPISDRGMIYTHLVAHYVSDEYKNY